MTNILQLDIAEVLQFSFIQRALISGSLIAVSCACLGMFLVLRRFSLIGDGLAHVSFATIGLGLLLNTYPIYVSIPLVMLSSLWILSLTERARLYGDAAIGLVSSLGVALGVLFASLGKGFNVDLLSYLFGSILAIRTSEVYMSAGLSIVVIALIILFYHDLFSITFDKEFSRASGIKTRLLNKMLILLTAMTVVLGIKVVGTLLISSLIIFPSITALQVSGQFKTALAVSAVTALTSVVLGILAAFVLDIPTGATIVLVNFCFFGVAFFYSHIAER